MNTNLAILAMALLPAVAAAQDECKKMRDHVVRLECYERYPVPQTCQAYGQDHIMKAGCLDVHYRRELTPQGPDEARQCKLLEPDIQAAYTCLSQAIAPPAPPPIDNGTSEAKTWQFQVREQSLAKFQKLNEAAQLGFKHENGRSDPLIKAALIGYGPVLGQAWETFVSLDLNIDLSAPGKQRANSKRFGAGVHGSFFDYAVDNFAIDTTARLNTKNDSETHTRSAGLVVSNLLVRRKWVEGGPWNAASTTFQFLPAFGLSYEKLYKVEAGKPKGAYGSVFGGANLTVWPKYLRRTAIVAKVQKLIDLSASGGLDKRYQKYASFGVEYYLYDPTDQKATFTPRLALLREVGDDALTDTADKNRTLLVFKFTLN